MNKAKLFAFVITIGLLYGVFLETGFVTTIFFIVLLLVDDNNKKVIEKMNKEINFLKSFAKLSGYMMPKDKGLN